MFPWKKTSAALVCALALTACHFTPLDQRALSEDAAIRQTALQKIAHLSDGKKDRLVGIFIQALRSNDNQRANRASAALAAVGPRAAKELVKCLGDGDPFVRVSAASTLGQIGPAARDTAPALVLTLKDSYPLVRAEAALSLGKIGSVSTDAIAALIGALADENPDVREGATEALVRFGVKQPPAKAGTAPAKPS